MIIQVDTEQVANLKKEGDKIIFSPDGEKVLVELYQLADTIEKAIKDTKEKIKETALKLDPNFTSIQGDNVKVSYRAYGSRYRIDESLIAELPKEFYKTKTSYSPIADVIEEFANKTGGVPLGVIEKDREKQIQIKVKGLGGDDE